jgi:hypothetical protein
MTLGAQSHGVGSRPGPAGGIERCGNAGSLYQREQITAQATRLRRRDCEHRIGRDTCIGRRPARPQHFHTSSRSEMIIARDHPAGGVKGDVHAAKLTSTPQCHQPTNS